MSSMGLQCVKLVVIMICEVRTFMYEIGVLK